MCWALTTFPLRSQIYDYPQSLQSTRERHLEIFGFNQMGADGGVGGGHHCKSYTISASFWLQARRTEPTNQRDLISDFSPSLLVAILILYGTIGVILSLQCAFNQQGCCA
jgi:hypothetical protein